MNAKCYFCSEPAEAEGNEPFICKECYNVPERGRAARRVWDARQELAYALKEALKVKHAGEPLIIANVFVFQNGNTAVTDQFGDQMPEYQGKWEEVRSRIYRQIEQQEKKPMLSDNYGIDKALHW